MGREPGSKRVPFSARQVVAIVVVIVAVVFILQNRRRTTVRFLVPEVDTPLWVALFVSALLGLVAGALLTSRRKR